MIAAIATVHAANGFFVNWFGQQKGEGFDYHLVAISLAFIVIVDGVGAASLDRLVSHRLEAKMLSDRPSAMMFPRVAMRRIVRRELFPLDRSLTFSICIDENV
jgi:hypothetical protein